VQVSLRVRSVSIVGFKSFGEKIKIDFSPRVNAVIGPNGSGKSNVIEGIRWASHTARTRELRARNATELIFHGSQGKAALGMAEVELELEGIDDRAAMTVTRRLYRDGDGDLELSGKTVRVRDLHDALRGSGLGPGGLAVVGQGEIGAVVGANPETMLGYLEEAAGLSRATHRRAQTIDRLETARQHFVRLEDVAGELRNRVSRLERDALSAREVEGLTKEAGTLERALYRARVASLREEIEKFGREIDRASLSAESSGQRIESITHELELGRNQREQMQVEFARRSGEVERLAGEARTLRERASAADAGLTSAVKERQSLELEAEKIQSLEAPEEPIAPTDDIATLQSDLERFRAELAELEATESRWQTDLREARTRRAALEGEFTQASAQVARSQAERESLERDLSEVDAELVTVLAERDRLNPLLEDAQTARDSTRVMLDRLEREAGSLSARIAEDATRIAELRATRIPLGKEQQRLETARKARTHLSHGPRKALESGIDGILGPVADLVRVPADLETAIGAAMGRRLENVVVRDGSVAREVIEILKRVGGRATFLPLDLLRSRPRRESAINNERGVRGLAVELIECDYAVVAENLLGETLVIETLERALELARKYPQRPRLVTLDGELLEPGGAVTGGRGRDTGGEAFAEARRLKEVSAELESLEQELEKLEARLESYRASGGEGRDAISRIDQRLQATSSEYETLRSALLSADSRFETLEDRRRNVTARLQSLPGAFSDLNMPELPDLEPLEVGLAQASERVAASRQNERQADAILREASSRKAVFLEQQRTFEASLARFAAARDRLTAINARLGVLEDIEMDARSRLEAANPEIVRLEAEADALNLTASRAELDALEVQRRARETDLANASRELSEAREALETAKLARARREANLETLLAEPVAGAGVPQSKMPEGETSEGETSEGQDELLEPLLESLEPVVVPVIIEPDPEGTSRSWAVRLGQIRARLEEIGPVNALAAEEHATESARLNELETSVTDAKAAVEELEQALDALERDVTAKLREAIRRVSDSFKSYVMDLLGGEGELETVRDEAGALEGLALVVTPKGKRTRNLHLLSAGERTMAALAFLFALASAPEFVEGDTARGLPLAVLDEVDAPLDEANIRRFTHFLTILADRGTQFILVTHQKATMEIADSLFGVTTDAGGVSRTFSVRNQAVAS
jgi:chromosome segregation protein